MKIKKIFLRIHGLYDTLVWVLLIWCIFQDFFLCVFLRFTGITILAKLMFYSKDIILLILFIWAISKLKIKGNILFWYVIYFAFIGMAVIVSVLSPKINLELTSLLSAVRGLVLLPTLTLIGYSVKNKCRFMENIRKYYKLLAVIAVIGIIEFLLDILVGTKSFWMDYLRLDDFYQAIKGASAGLENGTPGNWYTDIGMGFLTQDLTTLSSYGFNLGINNGRGGANIILGCLFDTGIIGTFFFIMFILHLYKDLNTAFKYSKNIDLLKYIILVTLLLIDFQFNNGIRMAYVWVILGLASGYAKFVKNIKKD